MTDQEVFEKASGIIGIEGMTVNERLYVSGLMETFDKAKRKNKELARLILKALKVDLISINKIIKK